MKAVALVGVLVAVWVVVFCAWHAIDGVAATETTHFVPVEGRCGRCGTVGPITEIVRVRRSWFGFGPETVLRAPGVGFCKACARELAAESAARDAEKQKQ